MSSSSLYSSAIKPVDRIQKNFIAYFRLFAGLPGINFVEKDITWIVSKGLPGNFVLRTKLPDGAIEPYLEETLRQIGQDGDHIDWLVFPGCQPAGLGQGVARYGMAGGPDGAWELVGKIGGPGGNWMLAHLTSLPSSPPVSAGFHVKRVGDESLLEEWRDINAEGFGGGDYQIFYDALARHGFGPDATALAYTGYFEETPVTSGMLLLAGGIAGIYNVSTPPLLRRRGFGSAITYIALQEARKCGYQLAYLSSSKMGKSVYNKLGFAAADFGIREYQWQKKEPK